MIELFVRSLDVNTTEHSRIHHVIMVSEELPSKPEAFPMTEKDHEILSMSDEMYIPHTWDNLKKLVSK